MEKKRIGNYVVVVDHDECGGENPREFYSNLGKMLLDGHRRYSFPVEIKHEDMKKAKIKLPVYMLDHSGIALSTHDFNDPWDSGLLGWICAFPDDIRETFGVKRITKSIVEKVTDILKDEVEIYNKYVNGEAYYYAIYKIENGQSEEEAIRNNSSCWSVGGFYDEKDAMNDGIEEANAMGIEEKKNAMQTA